MVDAMHVVFAGDDGWRVAAVEGDAVCAEDVRVADGADTAARAREVAARLGELGWDGGPVVLAIGSAWCLCAVISTEGIERTGRRKAMGYRLEEYLPVSSEDAVADYVPAGVERALGVCAELDPLRGIVDALEAAGVPVQHICPSALLAAEHAAGRVDEADAVVVGGRGGWDVVELSKGKPTGWRWLADDGEAVRRHLPTERGRGRRPVVAGVGWDGEPPDGELAWRTVEGTDADGAAARRAAGILAGAGSPWIDLRTGPLGGRTPHQACRRPVAALAAAVAMLLACVFGVTQWRARQYGALAARHERQQRVVFREALPDQRVPRNPPRRLASERRKLAGLGGQAAGADRAGTAFATSALTHLRNVLASLPAGLRFRILDLSIQPDLLRVDGQARNHVEAERVSVALRKRGGYAVKPPKTQALRGKGVSFLFTAEPVDEREQGGGG